MSSLIVPGGRPANLAPAAEVSYAYIVATETDGNTVVIPVDSVTSLRFKRQATPDDIYGAASFVLDVDGVKGMIVQDDPGDEPYESVFMVMAMPEGKILLSPDVFVRVNAAREFTRENVFLSLSVLRANIMAMKAADMTMASLANQAAFASRMSQDEKIKKELGL